MECDGVGKSSFALFHAARTVHGVLQAVHQRFASCARSGNALKRFTEDFYVRLFAADTTALWRFAHPHQTVQSVALCCIALLQDTPRMPACTVHARLAVTT